MQRHHFLYGTGTLFRDETPLAKPRYQLDLTYGRNDLPSVSGYLWLDADVPVIEIDSTPLRLVLEDGRRSLGLFVSGPTFNGTSFRYAVHTTDRLNQDSNLLDLLL